MSKFSEKQLDLALDDALRNDPAFATWFVDQTRFAGMGATYLWSRSDHPWSRLAHTTLDLATGESVTRVKEAETDVLMVFDTAHGLRFALHIGNKVSGGKFMREWPELYAVRAQMDGQPEVSALHGFRNGADRTNGLLPAEREGMSDFWSIHPTRRHRAIHSSVLAAAHSSSMIIHEATYR